MASLRQGMRGGIGLSGPTPSERGCCCLPVPPGGTSVTRWSSRSKDGWSPAHLQCCLTRTCHSSLDCDCDVALCSAVAPGIRPVAPGIRVCPMCTVVQYEPSATCPWQGSALKCVGGGVPGDGGVVCPLRSHAPVPHDLYF